MMWGFPGYGYAYGGGWLGMVLMMGVGLMVICGFVLLFARVARGGMGGGCGWSSYQPPVDQACDIAKQRYVRGEITKDEYVDICQTLGA